MFRITYFVTAFEGFSPNDNKVSDVYLRHIETYLRRKAGRIVIV